MRVLNSFQRVTSGRKLIPQIEGLRFMAIVSVVLFHIHASVAHNGAVPSPISGSSGPLIDLSKRGVELFFVLSGCILALPFAMSYLPGGAPVSLGAYFKRRLTRLEPPFVLSLLISLSLSVGLLHAPLTAAIPHLAASLLYSHLLIFGQPSTISFITWSLEIEVQFYILAPLLAKAFCIGSKRSRQALLYGAILVVSLLTLPLKGTPFEFSIVYYGGFFLAGFAACDYYTANQAKMGPGSRRWDVVAILGWPLVWALEPRTAHVLLPFLFVLLFVSAFQSVYFQRLLKNPTIGVIGGMCYSIYLIHYIPVAVTGRFTKPLHFGDGFLPYLLLQITFIIPVVLLTSAVYYLLIERPCMNKNWPGDLQQFFIRRNSSLKWLFANPKTRTNFREVRTGNAE